MMMDRDMNPVCDSMDQMHMDTTSKNSSLDMITDGETIMNGSAEGCRLEISEQAIREEMSQWLIANVKIVRKVAEKYVAVLFDAEVGSIDRLRKKIIRFPDFLRELQFDSDDCDDIVAALFAVPSACTIGSCSPASSGSSLDGSSTTGYLNGGFPSESHESCYSNGINMNASAALANALSIGNAGPMPVMLSMAAPNVSTHSVSASSSIDPSG